MFCAKCGGRNEEGISFCRRCGVALERTPAAPPVKSKEVKSKDPDELTASGIGRVIIGDGFFIVGVILSTTKGSVGSLLWLALLIPAFYCFGRGFTDIVHAVQIRRRQKQAELSGAANHAELPPQRATVADIFQKTISGELSPVPSVSERTARDLK